MTTAAMRWIDKAGGLDRYILETAPYKLGVGYPQVLRERMYNALIAKRKTEEAAKAAAATPSDAVTTAASSAPPAEKSAADNAAKKAASTGDKPKANEFRTRGKRAKETQPAPVEVAATAVASAAAANAAAATTAAQ
jgi:hypothetical protein